MNLLKLADYQIIVTIIMVLCAWKWGDWKNWRRYYPTIQFYVIGAFLYSLLSYNYPLWEFESPLLKTTLSDLLISLVFVPASLLIYLYRFPKNGLKKKLLFIILWVSVYTLIELTAYRLGFFSYHNGWNIWLSLLFNCDMFPLLWFHQKKPAWAILILLVSTVVGVIFFQIPISSMK